jgi:hypothetical protein
MVQVEDTKSCTAVERFHAGLAGCQDLLGGPISTSIPFISLIYVWSEWQSLCNLDDMKNDSNLEDLDVLLLYILSMSRNATDPD